MLSSAPDLYLGNPRIPGITESIVGIVLECHIGARIDATSSYSGIIDKGAILEDLNGAVLGIDSYRLGIEHH